MASKIKVGDIVSDPEKLVRRLNEAESNRPYPRHWFIIKYQEADPWRPTYHAQANHAYQ